MFDTEISSVGLVAGETDSSSVWDDDQFDDRVFLLTVDELSTGWVEPDRQVLPDDLEKMPVGIFLAAVVSSVDASRLNGHDVVRVLRARARLASHHEAHKYESMAEIAMAPPCDADGAVLRSSEQVEYAAVELAAALRLTRRSSESQLDLAVALSGRLHRVFSAFAAGDLDLARVRVFDAQLGHLTQEIADLVLDEILDDASDLTTGQLRARLAKLVMAVDPDGEAASFAEGLAERKVTTSANPDHTANLGVYSASPERVAAAREFIEKLARRLKTRGETRTLDQLRNDVALDLLSGRCVHGVSSGGRADIRIDAETLIGLSTEPGELGGFGPVIAEIGEKTVMENVDGEWTFCVTDNGEPVATGTLARRPTRSQCRQVTARYPKCVMVGCREDAWNCDLDHRRPHAAGGPTNNDNLGPLCRHHHMIRHHGYWQLERLPNGDHRWISPLGHTYIRKRGPPY